MKSIDLIITFICVSTDKFQPRLIEVLNVSLDSDSKMIVDAFQTATLDSGTMVSRVSEAVKDSDDDDDKKKEGSSKGRERLDDDQLFEACGGMTAHK